MSDQTAQDMMEEVRRQLQEQVDKTIGEPERVYVNVPGLKTPVFRALKEPKQVGEKTRAAGYEGRGPTGRFRNFKQMDDPKLIRTHESVRTATYRGTAEDFEALEKLEEELRYRSWLVGQWTPSS